MKAKQQNIYWEREYYPTRLGKIEIEKKKQAQSQLKQLSRQKFACEPDATEAVQRLIKRLRFYQIDANLIPNQDAIAQEQRKAGRFILATSVLEHHQLSNDQLLLEYKAQQSAEHGFRFLKDPLFFTSSVLLTGLKQNSSPNKATTLFISCKYVPILLEPFDKTIRYSCTKCL